MPKLMVSDSGTSVSERVSPLLALRLLSTRTSGADVLALP